jgi:hypothetical protein
MIYVRTKSDGWKVVRWISIEANGCDIAFYLNYTDQRTGCYLREYLGWAEALGM